MAILESIDLLKTRLDKLPGCPVYCQPQNTCAGILIPLVKIGEEWSLLFTRRSENVASHQNEVSFPGGSYESSDQTLESTALRETFEEIGILASEITLLGGLPSSTTITGFEVYPFVGILNWPINIDLNLQEVSSVFTIPVTWLLDKNNYYESDYFSEKIGNRKVIHYINYKGEHLWGFTAGITQQLLNLIK